MGCGSSTSTVAASDASVRLSHQADLSTKSSQITDESKVSNQTEGSTHLLDNAGLSKRNSSGVAFEVMLDDKNAERSFPRRLSRLEPIDAPRLTAEELEEKMRLAERKRNSALESRAKTASESRRQSKRKRELMIARELERQHQQAAELENKLRSAERQRELQIQQKTERQKLQEERMKKVRSKREQLSKDDVVSDMEQDENFNNDDVDSWLEGSNNGTNTVDTGFSSATSERIYSGRESPKKRVGHQPLSRNSYLNSASTVDSCDVPTYKQSRDHITKLQNKSSDLIRSRQSALDGDEFFDT